MRRGRPPRDLDGFILAGGASRRMGADKALVELGGRTLIEHVAAALAPVVGRLEVVGGEASGRARLGLETVPDRWPGQGALGGVGTALARARGERALVVACDLPFVSSPLLGYLAGLVDPADLTLCRTAAGPQPLCAVYRRSCLGAVERLVRAGRLRMGGLLAEVTVRVVAEEELVRVGLSPARLANLNTPEELERARRSWPEPPPP
jgi:molybdopterin-guanine dinucleotide biosynthesis protein A